MPRFPQAEPAVAALALLIMNGLTTATEDFPTPPVSAEELQARLEAYNAARKAAVTAESAAREHYAAKDDALEDLIDGMKADLRYAEIAVREQPEKLNLVGWAPRSTGSTLKAPGEVRDIAVLAEGEGWLVLDWKAPVDGGVVAAYTIQRRRRPDGTWKDIATAVETEALVSSQERSQEFEYRVVAVNKSGEGQPSGVVTAVL
jgi:hypothetical protein